MLTKNGLLKIGLVFAAALLIWGVVFSTVRAENRTGDKVSVAAEEVVNDDLFMAGQTISIEGVVNGNTYIAGQAIDIDGEMNGDLLIAGETITITGVVNDDIYAAGADLILRGAVVNDGVSFIGESLLIDENSEVTGGVMFLGSKITIDGSVRGTVRAAVESATFNGEIDDNIYLMSSGQVAVGDSAVIRGGLEYTSDNTATISETAVIDGGVVKKDPMTREGAGYPNLTMHIWSFIAAFVVGLTLLLIFPRPTVALSERILAYPLRSLVIGLLVAVITLPLFIAIMFTIVGIPLALILMAGFVISIYVAKIFTALALGRFILGKMNKDKPASPYLGLALGLFVVYLLFLIPVAGGVISFLVTLFGLGAIIYGLRRARTL